MAKPTKNKLTREGCQKELLFRVKADLRADITLLVILSLLFLPLTALSLWLAGTVVLLGILFTLICLTPLGVFVYKLIRDGKRKRLAEEGRFSILTDTVSRLSRQEPVGRSYADVIYFATYGRYIATGVTFDMASEGDTFYLVILHAKKDELCFAFPSMTYEYNE